MAKKLFDFRKIENGGNCRENVSAIDLNDLYETPNFYLNSSLIDNNVDLTERFE